MEFIDLKTQYNKYKDHIDGKIHAVLNHGQFIMGPEVEELEQELAQFVGVKHCISVASGTASLEIALRALNIGPSDEVITVPFTWISSAEVIMAVGAKPVFVDIEADSYNMNPELLESAINENTKAIMPVSLFGQMADLERIGKIAEKYELPVIEDAAQSFGATRHGKKSCGASLIGSTSFFPAKLWGLRLAWCVTLVIIQTWIGWGVQELNWLGLFYLNEYQEKSGWMHFISDGQAGQVVLRGQ